MIARHHEPLRHPADQGEHRKLGAVDEPELLEEPMRFGLRGLRGHAEEPAVEVQVLVDVERTVERVRLRHDADHLLGAGGVRHHIHTVDDRVPTGGDDAGGEHARGRGLARAVGPEQTEDLARAHFEVEMIDGEDVARVHLGELLGADHHVVGTDATPACICSTPVGTGAPFFSPRSVRGYASRFQHLDLTG